MLLILLGIAVVTGVLYLWKYLNKINQHWEERGIPHKKPLPLIGNSAPILLRRAGMVNVFKQEYALFPDAPMYGRFDFMKPYLVVKDLNLIERVLIKDFQHFTDHGFGMVNEDANPLDVNLFSMHGKKWKVMRNKFSPLFTTGKLRGMTPLIKDLSDAMASAFEKKTTDVEAKDMLQRFTMDVIASIAFGITANTIEEEEESEFRKMGRLAFTTTPMQLLRFFMITCFPKLSKKLGIAQNNPVVANYFQKILRETIEYRKNSQLTRNDFLQLMLTLQQKGSVEFEGDDVEDEYLKTEGEAPKTESYELTDEKMVGHAFIFLVAGFEGTANTMTYLCYELANNPECLENARREVAEVFKRRGVLDYDAIKEMSYLDQCLKETMRLHTFVPALFRACTKEYTFPETSVTLKVGDGLLIPIVGIHNDPAIYPEPEKFMPERFAPGVKRPACSWLPFGDGPRVCIAMRFALTEMKVAVARILLDYDLKVSSKTILPLELDPTSFGTKPKNPVYFNLTKKTQS